MQTLGITLFFDERRTHPRLCVKRNHSVYSSNNKNMGKVVLSTFRISANGDDLSESNRHLNRRQSIEITIVLNGFNIRGRSFPSFHMYTVVFIAYEFRFSH